MTMAGELEACALLAGVLPAHPRSADLPVDGARVFVHTNAVASWRFGFFFVQFICFFWLIGIIATRP
jgi:hypothetical protein